MSNVVDLNKYRAARNNENPRFVGNILAPTVEEMMTKARQYIPPELWGPHTEAAIHLAFAVSQKELETQQEV